MKNKDSRVVIISIVALTAATMVAFAVPEGLFDPSLDKKVIITDHSSDPNAPTIQLTKEEEALFEIRTSEGPMIGTPTGEQKIKDIEEIRKSMLKRAVELNIISKTSDPEMNNPVYKSIYAILAKRTQDYITKETGNVYPIVNRTVLPKQHQGKVYSDALQTVITTGWLPDNADPGSHMTREDIIESLSGNIRLDLSVEEEQNKLFERLGVSNVPTKEDIVIILTEIAELECST